MSSVFFLSRDDFIARVATSGRESFDGGVIEPEISNCYKSILQQSGYTVGVSVSLTDRGNWQRAVIEINDILASDSRFQFGLKAYVSPFAAVELSADALSEAKAHDTSDSVDPYAKLDPLNMAPRDFSEHRSDLSVRGREVEIGPLNLSACDLHELLMSIFKVFTKKGIKFGGFSTCRLEDQITLQIGADRCVVMPFSILRENRIPASIDSMLFQSVDQPKSAPEFRDRKIGDALLISNDIPEADVNCYALMLKMQEQARKLKMEEMLSAEITRLLTDPSIKNPEAIVFGVDGGRGQIVDLIKSQVTVRSDLVEAITKRVADSGALTFALKQHEGPEEDVEWLKALKARRSELNTRVSGLLAELLAPVAQLCNELAPSFPRYQGGRLRVSDHLLTLSELIEDDVLNLINSIAIESLVSGAVDRAWSRIASHLREIRAVVGISDTKAKDLFKAYQTLPEASKVLLANNGLKLSDEDYPVFKSLFSNRPGEWQILYRKMYFYGMHAEHLTVFSPGLSSSVLPVATSMPFALAPSDLDDSVTGGVMTEMRNLAAEHGSNIWTPV